MTTHRMIVLSLAALALSACETPPTVTMPAPFPLALGGVYVSVNRAEFKEAIERGLSSAGIPIAAGQEDVLYMLNARIGNPSAGSSGGCGSIRNVHYRLDYAIPTRVLVDQSKLTTPSGAVWSTGHFVRGNRAIEMKAKGYSGICASKIFNKLGAALRQNMVTPQPTPLQQ